MLNFFIVDDIKKANAVTHGGLFHADEVMATAIIGMANELGVINSVPINDEIKSIGCMSLYRVTDDNELKHAKDDAIIYDIGHGKFDHHQKGGNGSRNNIPYASAGLIWKKYGPIICAKFKVDPDKIDRILIQSIDARDNGIEITSTSKLFSDTHFISVYSISDIISAFNPNHNLSNSIEKSRFSLAVDTAYTILRNLLEKQALQSAARDYINDKLFDHNCLYDGAILVIDKYVPWKETSLDLLIINDIKIIIYPSRRKGFQWQLVPKNESTFETFIKCPEDLRGLRDVECQEKFGCSTAIFSHPTGFCGAAENLSDAIHMAEVIIDRTIKHLYHIHSK